MSEVKHTPAHMGRQWSAKSYGYEKYAILDDRGTEVGFAHRRRDANLIAAAPDLYEALEACEEMARIMEGMTECRGDDDWVWGIQEKIKTALDKARGE